MGMASSAHVAVFFSFSSLLSCFLRACALSFGVLLGRTKPMLLSRFVSLVPCSFTNFKFKVMIIVIACIVHVWLIILCLVAFFPFLFTWRNLLCKVPRSIDSLIYVLFQPWWKKREKKNFRWISIFYYYQLHRNLEIYTIILLFFQ